MENRIKEVLQEKLNRKDIENIPVLIDDFKRRYPMKAELAEKLYRCFYDYMGNRQELIDLFKAIKEA